jgi:hypothetical protein
MDKLSEALKIFGKEYIEAMGEILKKADKIASGDLIKSLKTRVFKTGFGTSYTLKVISAIHMKYVESGRRKGSTPPPVAPIKKWMKDKRIGLPEGAAYGIAKNIGKNGIKPLDVIEKGFKDVQKSIEYRKLEEGASDWVDDLIEEKLKGLSNKGNITFK